MLRLADEILFSFAERLRGVDHEPFEDPEISGIAGTAVSTNFSYEFARSLLSATAARSRSTGRISSIPTGWAACWRG